MLKIDSNKLKMYFGNKYEIQVSTYHLFNFVLLRNVWTARTKEISL